MAQGNTAVVVEVRRRNRIDYGHASETIGWHKQSKISRCAQLWWIQQGQRQFSSLRFDVIAIEQGQTVQWIQNAWQLKL